MIIEIISNGNKIRVPEGKATGSGSTHFTDSNGLDILYSDFFKKSGELTKKRKQHFYACQRIKEYIQNRIGTKYSYSELFAGVGIKAALFNDDMNSKDIMLNDLDKGCVDVLRDNFLGADLYMEDSFAFEFKKNYDIHEIDINNYTILKYEKSYKGLVDNVFRHANKYVILNDCSISYVHKDGGKNSFKVYGEILGKEINTEEEFIRACVEYYENKYKGWRGVYVARCLNTNFILFEKTEESGKCVIDFSGLDERILEENPAVIIYREGVLDELSKI